MLMWKLDLDYFKYENELGLDHIMKIVEYPVISSIFEMMLLHNCYGKVFTVFVLLHIKIFDMIGSEAPGTGIYRWASWNL